MQINQSVAELSARLDAWLNRSLPVFSAENEGVPGSAMRRAIAIMQEFNRLRAGGMAALRSALKKRKSITERQREELLIQAFEFGAKLRHALHDQFLDTARENKVAKSMHAVVKALDEMRSGRVALAELLDRPDPGVRASAGAYLIDMMPDRVMPVLRQIEEGNKGSSAGFSAH